MSEIDSYVEAARNKLAIARVSRAELDGLRRGEEDERPAIQRTFEALLSNGISAGDQLSAPSLSAPGYVFLGTLPPTC